MRLACPCRGRFRLAVLVLAVMLGGCSRTSLDFPPCRPAQVAERGDAVEVTCWMGEPVDVIAIGAQPVLGPYAHASFLTAVDRFGPTARALEFDAGALTDAADGWRATLGPRGRVQGHRVLGVRVEPPAGGEFVPSGSLGAIVGALASAYPAATRADLTVVSSLSASQGAMFRLELMNWRVVAVDWSDRVD